MSTSWILAIDFGTSYTLLAAKVDDRRPEVVEIRGDRRVPSVVMVEAGGQIVVGRTADDLSGSNPSQTLRSPKNRLGDQAPVVLGGRPYQAVQLVAALLTDVYREAVAQQGGEPAEVRLTHPAAWNRPRLNRLLEAAAKAGIPNPVLVPEPVAAAFSYASEIEVPDGAHVAVYDLGGGTFDSAVVTAANGVFSVQGRPGGDSGIGGELFDELLANHVGEQLDPDDWERIQVADERRWQQVGAALRRESRKAKETLSSHPYAEILLPLPDGMVQYRITREEFDEIVRPYIDETITVLRRCIADAGIGPDRLYSIYLVGGASRSPIVEEAVTAAFPGVMVSRRGDPKASVALGAARAMRLAADQRQPGQARPGGTTQPASAVTAEEGVLLGPPSGQPSDPSPPPHSDPSQPQTPSPPPAPSSHPSQPAAATTAATDSQPSQPDAPRPSATTQLGAPIATPPPAAPNGPSPQPQPLTPGSPGGQAGDSKRSKAPLFILAAVAAVAAIVIGVVALGGDGDEADQPTTPTVSQVGDPATTPAGTGTVASSPTAPSSTPVDTTPVSTIEIVPGPSIVPAGEVPDRRDLSQVLWTLDDASAAWPDDTWEVDRLFDAEVPTDFEPFCGFVPPRPDLASGRTLQRPLDLSITSIVEQFESPEAAETAFDATRTGMLDCVGESELPYGDTTYQVTITDTTSEWRSIVPDGMAIDFRVTDPDQPLATIEGTLLIWVSGSHVVSGDMREIGEGGRYDDEPFRELIITLAERTAALE